MELETRRLLLRPLRDDDAHAIVNGLNNYNVAKNLSRVPFPYAVDDATFFINLQRGFDPRSKICAITFKCAPDELIGVIAYEYMREKGELDLGYWLRECCWHMGIMSEAAAALVRYAFTVQDIDNLVSGYFNENPNSGHILRRLGFENDYPSTTFSIAQGKDVPVTRFNLTLARWAAKQESRAA